MKKTTHYHFTHKKNLDTISDRFDRIKKKDDRSTSHMFYNIKNYHFVTISYDWDEYRWTCIGHPISGFIFEEIYWVK